MIAAPVHREYTMYQTSTISALLAGVYDGDVTVAELLRHGNLGIGTFNHLDGEMIVLDGRCFQLLADGSAHEAVVGEKTPYAVVTNFHPQKTLELGQPHSRSQLTSEIDQILGDDNTPAVVRIRGTFPSIRTRTVARQEPPYVPLIAATADEVVNQFTGLTGTIVGFRTPRYEAAISVPGYHLHFIDDRHQHGGHVLDFQIQRAHIEMANLTELHLSIPKTAGFRDADMSALDVEADEKQAEG